MPDLQIEGGLPLLRGDQDVNTAPEMTLAAIVDEICNRVNDPYNENYKVRAEALFLASIWENLPDDRFSTFDYFGLVGTNTIHTGYYDLRVFDLFGLDNDVDGESVLSDDAKYIYQINNIVSKDASETNSESRKFVPISIEEANRISTDPELEPIYGEVYWYKIAENLYFHPSPTEDMRSLKFVIEYIHSGFAYGAEEDMCKKFSIPFLMACIDTATTRLIQEVNLT